MLLLKCFILLVDALLILDSFRHYVDIVCPRQSLEHLGVFELIDSVRKPELHSEDEVSLVILVRQVLVSPLILECAKDT